jgi:VWFA-related protein
VSARLQRLAVLTAAIVALALPANHAQQPPRSTGTVTAGVTAVLVDIVVRDKRGEPVRDLTQADFEVTEDGVPQTIGSFTPIFDGQQTTTPETVAAAPPADASPAVGSPPPISAGPAITALVFDRLTPEARQLAVQAAQSYLEGRQEAPGYIGIFGVDLALTSYAPFTRSAHVLRQALATVASRASTGFNNPEQQQRQVDASRRAEAAGAAVASAGAVSGPGAGAAMGTTAGDEQLARIEANMLEAFDVMEREQQGYATTNALFAIISTLGKLPGRKSLVLFSEGIAIPPAVQRLFLGVIDAANRANVAIYTMDAAGLRAASEQTEIGNAVNKAASRGINSGYTPRGADNGPLTRVLENNEYVLRSDPHTGFGELAQGTGGLVFDNTNNLRQGFDRVESDQRNYYVVGYTPTNNAFDGRFRTIQVKVNRPGVTVAARKGYFAVRDAGGLPVNSWEAPALGAVERKPVPNAFPIRAAAMLFPERDRPGLVPVVVDFATAPLTFQPAADGKTYTSDFAVLVRFLDQHNRVARKVSQHYEVNGPIANLERAKRGEVVFYREPELPAGVYTMETVVYDAPSGKSSVRFSTVEVPRENPDDLRMSSLVVIKRAEKVPEEDRRPDNPLLVKDVILRPNLGEPVSKSSKEVGFYFAIYPASGGAPESSIELLRNGTFVARLPLPLASVDASGRIQQVGRLPLDQLSPETYELRAVVKQGTQQIVRSTMLRITD